MDYRAAWYRGFDDCKAGATIEACPFDNAGEAKMWFAGWYYARLHAERPQ